MSKTSSRFRQTGIAPKASARLPFAHRGWDVSVTLEHGTKAPKHVASPKTECGCALCVDKYEDWRGERLPRAEGNRRAIAEELAHSRDLRDMEAIEEDGYADGCDYFASVCEFPGCACGNGAEFFRYADEEMWRADWEPGMVLTLVTLREGYFADEDEEFAAEEELFVTYVELMQAPTEVPVSYAHLS